MMGTLTGSYTVIYCTVIILDLHWPQKPKSEDEIMKCQANNFAQDNWGSSNEELNVCMTNALQTVHDWASQPILGFPAHHQIWASQPHQQLWASQPHYIQFWASQPHYSFGLPSPITSFGLPSHITVLGFPAPHLECWAYPSYVGGVALYRVCEPCIITIFETCL
jgi:hypothetical protein